MNTVFVAGGINMDVVAVAARHPRVGETVVGREVRFLPGGKGANQAVSSARLGSPTALIGRLGADPFGRELRAAAAIGSHIMNARARALGAMDSLYR
jgi:ribokinase